MKLGTETGSLINHLLSKQSDVSVEVGMGATLLSWSDRSPATVIKNDGKRITVQADKYTRTDTNGLSDTQEYDYTCDPTGYTQTFSMDKDGKYIDVYFNKDTNRWNKSSSGNGIRFGARERYFDFSF